MIVATGIAQSGNALGLWFIYEQSAGNLIDEPFGAIGVEPLGRDPCGPGLGVCEGRR